MIEYTLILPLRSMKAFLYHQTYNTSCRKGKTKSMDMISCNYDIDFLYYCATYQVGHIYGESVDINKSRT